MILLSAALVSITLSKAVCFAPCEVTVRLHVESAADNQKVRIEVTSEEGYFRSSDIDVNEKSPVATEIRYQNLPFGNYQFKAILFKHDGRTWIAAEVTKQLTVTGYRGK